MNTQTVAETSTDLSPRKRLVSTFSIVLGIIILLALVGLFIWGALWLAQNQAPTVEAMRDIFIIALAMESCLFGIVLIILLVMVIRLVNMIEFEIKPILEKTNETVGMVRGTTVFVGDNVVKPVTTVNSYVAGIRRGLKALFGNPDKLLHD
jgi:hypothetical protein